MNVNEKIIHQLQNSPVFRLMGFFDDPCAKHSFLVTDRGILSFFSRYLSLTSCNEHDPYDDMQGNWMIHHMM